MQHSTIGWRNFIYPGFCRSRAHSTSPKWWQGCGLRTKCVWTMHPSTIGWRNFIYPGFCRRQAHSTSPQWWQGCSLRRESYWTMQPSDSWSRDMVRCRCVSWSKPCVTTRVCSSRWCYAADLLRSHWTRNDTFLCQSIWSCLEHAETHRAWNAGSTPKSSSGLTWRTVVGRSLPGKARGQPCRCQWSLKASVSHLASNRTELDGKWSNMWGPNKWTVLILGLWVGLQGLKFGCCYTSHHPSMFFLCFW